MTGQPYFYEPYKPLPTEEVYSVGGRVIGGTYPFVLELKNNDDDSSIEQLVVDPRDLTFQFKAHLPTGYHFRINFKDFFYRSGIDEIINYNISIMESSNYNKTLIIFR